MDAPSNKKQKTESNEVATEQKAPKGGAFAFEKLGRELQSQILGFLVCPPRGAFQERRFRSLLGLDDPLLQDIRSMTKVSLEWRQLVSELMNQYNISADIVSVSELADLKRRVAKMDLSSIKTNFIKDIRARWGGHRFIEDVSALDYIVENGFDFSAPDLDSAYDIFAEMVAQEYKTFLVVKCVETLVMKRHEQASSNEAIEAWKEKCCPSRLIDLLWHAHMLSPKKYAEDCNSLINEVVDHDASYISSKSRKGSDFDSKAKQLYKFEYLSEKMLTRRCNWILNKVAFHVKKLANAVFETINDMYEDEVGCG